MWRPVDFFACCYARWNCLSLPGAPHKTSTYVKKSNVHTNPPTRIRHVLMELAFHAALGYFFFVDHPERIDRWQGRCRQACAQSAPDKTSTYVKFISTYVKINRHKSTYPHPTCSHRACFPRGARLFFLCGSPGEDRPVAGPLPPGLCAERPR